MAARKPENTFIAAVNRLLPDVYHEKMNNPYRSGTPDVWYSGSKADLWVEYKYVLKLPVNAPLRVRADLLSEQQVLWLARRFVENRHVIVVVGCPEGCLVLSGPHEWERNDVHAEEFRRRMIPRAELAGFIRKHTTGISSCPSPSESSPRQQSPVRRIVSSSRRS